MRFARLSWLLLTMALLCSCSSESGALFSVSGVNAAGASTAGRSGASAGAETGGADVAGAEQGGASSAGADNIGGSSELGGASSSAGEPSNGGPIAGNPSAGSAGSAGTASAGVGGAPAPSACDGQTVTAEPLVANFEAGVAGWSGYLGEAPYAVDSTQPGAAGTEHALRFAGGAAKTSGFFHLLPCNDVSGFEGIQFWARSSNPDPVRFLAVIPATDPTEGVGDCREPAMKCSDHPGKVFTFSKQWQLYRASWLELKQYGWGTKAKFSSLINAVLWINDGPVGDFDLAIDEVTLYKSAPR